MSKNKTVWLALLTMLLWGSLFPMVKLGFSAYHVVGVADILVFAGLRFVICGGVICLFAAGKDIGSFRAAKDAVAPILLSGVFAIVLHYGFTYVGLELTDSSKTALLKQVGALLFVCFSFLFIKEERPTVRKIGGAVLGFFGILALNFRLDGLAFSIGDLCILCASFCTVASNVISKKVFARVSPITSTGISQLFGGAVLLAVGCIMGGGVHIAWDHSLWIMGYICLASTVSYCLWFGIVKHAELSRLFIIKFAEPIFACIFGAIILGESIWRLSYLFAFLLISAGIWLSSVGSKAKTSDTSPKQSSAP